MYTILIAEDDPAVAEGLRRTLEADGFTVKVAVDGRDALTWLERLAPDLIIADIMMPGMNGYQLFQRVRQNPDWVWIPFIFLTARSEVEDVRYGKELGADDYLTKPIEPEDLVAAVRGRLVRYEQLGSENRPQPSRKLTGQYAISGLLVDLARRQVLYDEQEINLSPTEFEILQCLLLADGAVVEYEELLGYDDGEVLGVRDAAELLRYHVRNLRNKLKSTSHNGDLIENVRSVGYRLTERATYHP